MGIAAGADRDKRAVVEVSGLFKKKKMLKGHWKQDPSVNFQGTFSFEGPWCGREGCVIQ